MQTNTMTTDPAAALHFSGFPRYVLNLDRDLETRFLGSDLSAICDAAYESDIPILKACIASPLKKREEALAAWRAEQVKAVLADPSFALKVEAFFALAPEEEIESFHAGEMPLNAADSAIKIFWHKAESARIDARRAAKNALWNAVSSLTADGTDASPLGKPVPRHVLILTNGKISFWRYRANALGFAKSAGMPCLLMGIDGTRVKAWNLEKPLALAEIEAEEPDAYEEDEDEDMDAFMERLGGPNCPFGKCEDE